MRASFAISTLLAAPALAQPCLLPAYIQAPDGISNEWFGYRVAVNADRVLIGARYDHDSGPSAGSAYIWQRVAGNWVYETEIHPQDAEAGDNIGSSVALLNDLAVIGAEGDDDNGTNAGAVYVYRLLGNTWTQEAKLTPLDAQPNQVFGRALSVTTDRIIVGSQFDDDNGTNAGSAYIFAFDGSNWSQQAKLLPDDGHPGQFFGWDVAISGDLAAVGAMGDNTAGVGSVYAYRFDGNSWNLEQELIPSDTTHSAGVGMGVDAFFDLIIANDAGDDENGTDAGAAWIWRHDGNSWIEEAKLTPADAQAGMTFAWRRACAISSNFAMIGAINADGTATNTGAAYLFQYDGNTWVQHEKLFADDGAFGDNFGRDVSFRNAAFAVGVPLDHNSNGADAGSAWIYDLTDVCCPADLDGNGTVDADDFFLFLDAVVNNFLDQCDLDLDGDCDADDFFLFLDLFAQGCD